MSLLIVTDVGDGDDIVLNDEFQFPGVDLIRHEVCAGCECGGTAPSALEQVARFTSIRATGRHRSTASEVQLEIITASPFERHAKFDGTVGLARGHAFVGE